jgi:hypothetical protein
VPKRRMRASFETPEVPLQVAELTEDGGQVVDDGGDGGVVGSALWQELLPAQARLLSGELDALGQLERAVPRASLRPVTPYRRQVIDWCECLHTVGSEAQGRKP